MYCQLVSNEHMQKSGPHFKICSFSVINITTDFISRNYDYFLSDNYGSIVGVRFFFCNDTNLRYNIPRIISSTGCSNCRMETCLKGEEVEDACLFVGTKVFITGTKAKGVVTKVVAKEPWCIATFSNANIDQKIDFPFHKDYSVFSYDC